MKFNNFSVPSIILFVCKPKAENLKQQLTMGTSHMMLYTDKYICMYIGFKTFFYIARHLDSYLPTGLHLGSFRAWPSLFLPSSFSAVFPVLSFVLAPTSTIFWQSSFCHSLNMAKPCAL